MNQKGYKDIKKLPIFFLRLRVEILNVLYVLEALRHDIIVMPGLLPRWTRKDIEQLPNFFFQLRVKILNVNVLYILEALRHNNIVQGLLPGCFFYYFRLRIEMLNVLYILQALRHNNMIMPGLLPGWTRKRGDEWSNKIFNCSICSQNLNECWIARTPKIFAVARTLAFLSVCKSFCNRAQ